MIELPMAARRETRNQPQRPFSIELEFVEGCSRICSFCGIKAIRSKPGNYKYMSRDVLTRMVSEIARCFPTTRIEVVGHGEPTMHPDYIEYLRFIRAGLPNHQIQLTTNGVKFRRGRMQAALNSIFDAGVDFVLLSLYDPEGPALKAQALDLDDTVDVVNLMTDCQPVGWSPWYNHHRKVTRRLVLIDDLIEHDSEIVQRTIDNRAGNSGFKPPLPEAVEANCTLPFRSATTTFDGEFLLCCMDWKREREVGNVMQQPADDIWFLSPPMQAMRSSLSQKDRNFDPCKRCDFKGKRVGLLPKYDPPTDDQRKRLDDPD